MTPVVSVTLLQTTYSRNAYGEWMASDGAVKVLIKDQYLRAALDEILRLRAKVVGS